MNELMNQHSFLSSLFSVLFRHRPEHSTKQTNYLPNRLQPPTIDDRNAWSAYWRAQNQPWRTEPEIDTQRQEELTQRRAIVPDVKEGSYPFKSMKLSRADVEWLLATHENGRGPVDWSVGGLRDCQGLDLRGADLCRVNLSRLPLTGTYGALDWEEWLAATTEQREAAVIHLEEANLSFTHLERAILRGAHLEKAMLYGAHLEGAYLYTAHLDGAILKRAFLDGGTQLGKIVLASEKFGAASLADVRWGDANLTEVNWELLKESGEEQKAHWQKKHDGTTRKSERQLNEYHRAVRTNWQLADVLQGQGLNDDAARFAYRAQLLQRIVLRRHGKFGQYLFSLFLDLLTGYGYKPLRSFLAYLIVILVFATTYYVLGQTVGPSLSPVGSVVFSMTSFHGRGFFPGGIKLDDPLTVIAAIEAFVGLLIEVTFIATLTQRLFRK
jgi:uncharacterized protein YjbI with pentapeptide repeats